MSPLTTGVYRIKISEKDEYWQLHAHDSTSTVSYAAVDEADPVQLWNVVEQEDGTYKITSYEDELALTVPGANEEDLPLQFGASTTWKIDQEGSFFQLSPVDKEFGGLILDRNETTHEVTLGKPNAARTYQHFGFECVQDPPPVVSKFQGTYFKLTPKQAQQQGPYDIIIIGAGYGGGVLAADLFDTNTKIGSSAKKILLLEKGGLIFHSHCLNSARPTNSRTGRDQFNHTFYNRFKSNYIIAKESQADWGGGPVYGVGGRSSIWSLAAPRAHDKTLHDNFPKKVADELLSKYYSKAEELLSLYLPRTRPEHRQLLDRLTMTSPGDLDVAWQWARIASEFREDRNFDFGRGAFSSIDKLLEIAMNKPVDKDNNFIEHENFKILLDAEAREILWHATNEAEPRPRAVRIRTFSGVFDIPLKQNGRVVLSAGSVNSPGILLRSNVDLKSKGGLNITDHNILVHNSSYRYREPSDRDRVGSLKLRSFLNLPGSPQGDNRLTDITLASLYIDSSPFLYRGAVNIASNDVPALVTTFMMRTPLESTNTITLDPRTREPIVKIGRTKFEIEYWDAKEKAMKDFNENAKKVLENVLNVDFIPDANEGGYFKPLPIGGGGHEMGTIPMVTPKRPNGCADENQKLLGYQGVYIADNSIFPYVPEANPSLTLTALTIRLSRHLVSRTPVVEQAGAVAVVNHTGEFIKISVSTTGADAIVVESPSEFEPGRYQIYYRSAAEETAFVYKLDLAKDQSQGRVYLTTPEFHVVQNGRLIAIL